VSYAASQPRSALPRRCALLGALAAPAACFVAPVAEPAPGVLRLAVELPVGAPRVAAASAQPNPWDGQGLFQLRVFPKYVRVAVELDDYELASASWPDRERGAPDETSDGAVSVELKVPAGENRRLHLLAFVAPAAAPLVAYAERAPLPLSLAAGEVTELILEAAPHDTGEIEATVRCKQGNVSSWEPSALEAVDARALVVHPPVPLAPGASTSALGCHLPAVPVGRPHWARIRLRNKATDEQAFVDVRQPTFAVAAPGERAAINLAIPCGP
jgi:hypothetical protein